MLIDLLALTGGIVGIAYISARVGIAHGRHLERERVRDIGAELFRKEPQFRSLYAALRED